MFCRGLFLDSIMTPLSFIHAMSESGLEAQTPAHTYTSAFANSWHGLLMIQSPALRFPGTDANP